MTAPIHTDQIRLFHDNVLCVRAHSQTQQVYDPVYKATRTISFDGVGDESGLVLPSKKNISRATVISTGPKVTYLASGDSVILPGPQQDIPLASWYNENGDVLEIWREDQIHVRAKVIHLNTPQTATV